VGINGVNKMKIILDLFSGLEGASRAFKERGWDVITVDINDSFEPDICCDIVHFSYPGSWPKPDLIWASPPCTEFSRRSLPASWACNGGKYKEPDMSLLDATIRIIKEAKPRYWVIENVSGAIRYFKPYLGSYQKKVGSRYLWGQFPIFDCDPGYGKWRLPPSSDRAARRSLIPYQISKALCMAIEQDLQCKIEGERR
jgi:hypothetical protein